MENNSLNDIMLKLDKPDFKLEQIDVNSSEDERQRNLSTNYERRMMYINSQLQQFFPEEFDIVKEKIVNVEDYISIWKQILTHPDDRLYLEAARLRAISHEQKPAEFSKLDLTDLDYYECQNSLRDLTAFNKGIEQKVRSTSFQTKSKEDRKIELKKLFSDRDTQLHPLVFILTLNVDDLPRKDIRKLDAKHSIGEHDEAKILARELVDGLRRKAISEYRQCCENNTKFLKSNYRDFS